MDSLIKTWKDKARELNTAADKAALDVSTKQRMRSMARIYWDCATELEAACD